MRKAEICCASGRRVLRVEKARENTPVWDWELCALCSVLPQQSRQSENRKEGRCWDAARPRGPRGLEASGYSMMVRQPRSCKGRPVFKSSFRKINPKLVEGDWDGGSDG